jgi:hypothetical protein
MEPTQITPPGDSELEALLREGLGRPPLRDDGFTARVMDSLPQRRSFPHFRIAIALGWASAAAGISVALWAGSSGLGLTSTDTSFGGAWLSIVCVTTLMSCLVAWFVVDSAHSG